MSRLALARWPLATGAALLVYVATGVSLAVATNARIWKYSTSGTRYS